MYTKIIQHTKSVYILYTKIVEIKVLYDNECTRNLHQTPTQLYTKNVQNVQNLYKFKLKTAQNLKCMYNYTKCIQMLIESCMWTPIYVCFLYSQNPYILYF